MQAKFCIDIVVIKSASKSTKSLTYLYLIVHTYFLFLPPPAPRVTTNPSSISIKLVSQECFLNRLTQHGLFCDDFSSLSVTLSRSIHILCIKFHLLRSWRVVVFKGLNNSQLVPNWPLKDIWAMLGWVLWTRLLETFTYRFLCGYQVLFLCDKCSWL